jgi:multidrug resistance efflux pump
MARAEQAGTEVEHELVRVLYSEEDANFRELNEIRTRSQSLTEGIKARAPEIEQAWKRFEEADQRWYKFSQESQEGMHLDRVLTPLRLEVDVRQRELEDIVRRIDACVLRAPFDGRVSELFAQEGRAVLPGDPLVTVSPTSSHTIVAFLPERHVRGIAPGSAVVIQPMSVGSGPREIEGYVESLAPAIREVPVRYRHTANTPMWGRQVIVALAGGETLLPGEPSMLRFWGSAEPPAAQGERSWLGWGLLEDFVRIRPRSR